MVYRLITENSVELKILARANSKRKLERVVVSKGMFRKPKYALFDIDRASSVFGVFELVFCGDILILMHVPCVKIGL